MEKIHQFESDTDTFNKNVYNQTALHIVAEKGLTEIAKILLENGCDF